MVRYLSFFIFLVIIKNVFAQSFIWQVGDTIKNSIPSSTIEFHTYVRNMTPNVLNLRWTVMNATLPGNWSGGVCTNDNGCQIYFTAGLFDDFNIDPDSTDYVFIDFITDSIPAIGDAIIKIENINNPGEYFAQKFIANTRVTSVQNKKLQVFRDYKLYQNFPNPFNPVTKIPFEIGGHQSQQTVITIYNIVGQIVKTVLDQKMNPGVHQVIWDGTNNQGRLVSSGLYLYEMRTQNVVMMGKMFLLK